MKRISFFGIVLCALLLTMGASSLLAQTGAITLKKVDGLYLGAQVYAGQNVRFVFNYNNATPLGTTKACDLSNGFKVSSPDGAVWDSLRGAGLGTLTWYADSANWDPIPDTGIALYPQWSWYGDILRWPITKGLAIVPKVTPTAQTLAFANPTVVGILAAGSPRLPNTFNDSLWAITVYFHDKTSAGKHICIDSSFYPPGGTWKWVGANLVDYFPTWNGTPGVALGSDPYCFEIFDVPNLKPEIVNTGYQCGAWPPAPFVDPTLSGGHCSSFTYDFDACDKEGDPITFHLGAGSVGAIDPSTGVWTANTLATGDYTVSVYASDPVGGDGTPVNMTVHVTNAAPVISGGCGTNTITNTGATKTVQMAGTDADACDPKNWSIVSVTPNTATVGISTSGLVTFTTNDAGLYTVTVGLSDGVVAAPVTCDITFDVKAGSLYGIRIEKTHNSLQGQFQRVNVYLENVNPTDGIGGFDILIAYDNSALSLQGADVTTSQLYSANGCKWEYFTYRYGANGNCSGGCPSGLVRAVGLAETNNGAAHPVVGCPTSPIAPPGIIMFSLNFLVSNDRTLECQYVPIRFFWIDCGDNSVSSFDGSKLYIASRVFDFHNQDVQIDPALATFPGYAGVPAGFCTNPTPGKPAPERNIDFFDGGIDIVCADSIDLRGDINLNGTAYEIADAVMFTNYFIKGFAAFTVNIAGSTAASDVNADGLALSVADLVYLIRVIVGDALPYPKTTPVVASYTNDNGKLSVTEPMGAAYVTIQGTVVPQLLATNMQMQYASRDNNTYVIVYPDPAASHTESFSGDFLNANGTVINVEMATAEGAPVVAKNVPANFTLGQNYPNPFNPTTDISFSLPFASQYTLTVYNVTGQKVWENSGEKAAGSYTVSFNGANLASGIYFYKLNAGTFSATKKMVLLK